MKSSDTGRALEVDYPWFNLAAMRRLLLFVTLIGTSIAFPMCTDGQTPLMETNDAFTCDRGCPVGFNCEFQDADHTMTKAICCPNITALQQLYGDDEHSEPIWDLFEVASLSVGLDSATAETTSYTRQTMAEDGSATTVPQYQQPTAVTASSSAEKTADAAMVEEETTTEENTVKPTTGSYEEIRNMEEIDQSLTLLEPMQEVASTLPSVSVIVEIEGSGDLPEQPTQRKSCARQKYSVVCRNGTVRTQATIRWWKNTETGDCEYYPFGYCPGDRVVESVTIRSKIECEMSCHVLKTAGPSEEGGENASPKDEQGKESYLLPEGNPAAELPAHLSSSSLNTSMSVTISPKSIGKIAIESTNTIDDAKPEKRQENIAIDPVDPTLFLNAVAEPSPPGMSPMDFETTTDMTVSLETKDLPSGAQQENLEHLSPLNLQSGEEDNTSTKRVHPPLIIVQEKISSGAQIDKKVREGISSEETLTKENNIAVNGDNLNDTKTPSEELSNLIVVEEKKKEGIKMRLEPNEKARVSCEASSYRYSCLNGHPSQFVYRWGMVGDICQSFAYGYCYGEMNLPYPRTQEECLLYCKPKTHRVLSL